VLEQRLAIPSNPQISL